MFHGCCEERFPGGINRVCPDFGFVFLLVRALFVVALIFLFTVGVWGEQRGGYRKQFMVRDYRPVLLMLLLVCIAYQRLSS